MPMIHAGSFQVEYSDVGAGPAVLLIHSSSSGNRQWRKLTERLKDRYRVFAVNLFGYGKTSRWPGERPQAVTDQAELALAVAANVDEPVTVIGHSLGGSVAFETAMRLGGRLRELIVFEPVAYNYLKTHGPWGAYEEIEDVAARFVELAKRGDWRAAGEHFIDYWSGKGMWNFIPEEKKEALLPMLRPVVHEWEMAESGARPLEAWAALTAPVHLVSAKDTKYPAREIVKLFAKTYPRWHAHEIAKGGHMAPVARHDLVNPLLADILDGKMELKVAA